MLPCTLTCSPLGRKEQDMTQVTEHAHMLTYNIDIGIGKDSAMDIWSFTLVHSGVIRLYIGKTDFPGRDDITRKWIPYKGWKKMSAW